MIAYRDLISLPQSKNLREEALRSSRSYYARRARYYDLFTQRKRKDAETTRELDFIEHAFKTHAARPIKEVLDIACGGGRHVVGLAKRGYECTGYDLTPERIEVARERAIREKVSTTLETGDATKLDFKNSFDAVLALYILFLLPNDDDIQKCLKALYRSLWVGGLIVCNLFNPFTVGKNEIVEAVKRQHSVSEMKARGIRMTEIQKLHRFDPIRGVLWVDETTFFETSDGSMVFRDRERLRLLTYWDLKRYLEIAGFHEIECYPDWKMNGLKNPKAEQLVFVARK